jgi:outer membrane lipoprotein SlyB
MGQSTAASSNPNATVMAVEVVPRQAGSSSGAGMEGAGSAAGAMGSSGTAGSTGSSTASDRVYRITLRMDDGSTQVVTQETTPDFRSGDRVNLAGGMIQH